jgi:hypothetical protein
VFSRSIESDERKYIRHVEEWCGRTAVKIDGDTFDTTGTTTSSGREEADPFISTRGPDPIEMAFAGAAGSVLLTGELGDLVTAKSRAHCTALLELWSSGQWTRFVRELIAWSTRTRTPVHRALGRVCRPLATRSFDDYLYRRTWQQNMRLSLRTTSANPEGYGLHPAFLARCRPGPSSFAQQVARFRPSKRVLARGLYYVAGRSRMTSPESLSTGHVTHPYADRRLVNFVLAIPHRALWKVDVTRSLMKDALAGVLPEAILTRTNKGDADPSLTRDMVGAIAALGSDCSRWQIVQREYAEPETLSRQVVGIANARSCTGVRKDSRCATPAPS